MGIPATVAEILFAENQHKQIRGDIGFIGRQTTYLRSKTLVHLGHKYGIISHHKEREGRVNIEYDYSTRGNVSFEGMLAGGERFITDKCLMEFLGADKFKAIDVSNYEGADIVCDLSQDIPLELHKSCDFIFDGSCLDNIFNPATALKNISRLLRPGGRAMLLNHATWFNGPYSIFLRDGILIFLRITGIKIVKYFY